MILDDASSCLPNVLFLPKVLRDLLWAATSPHMLSGDRFPVLPPEFGVEALKFNNVINWLNSLVADPTPLLTFLQETTSSGRLLALGVYFSTLLEFWLRFCPHFGMEKMEIGKQIVSSTNRTVGQLKFLFRCNFQLPGEVRDFHVESSVKFFLLNPIDNGAATTESEKDVATVKNDDYIPLEQYVGPHLGENLAWRVQEVDRKLAMRRGESVRAWLDENYSNNVQSHIVLRGYLFEPLSHFVSTSQTTMAHDWKFHRNLAISTQGCGSKTLTNPSIAANHLRGWWSSDMETDLPAKVRANDQAVLGESRFVILPKLHWLCPVVAVEVQISGQVIVEGDNRLGIPEVVSLTLEELMKFVRDHFQQVSGETNKTGGIAMPLLVAEIVRCPNNSEFIVEGGRQHWYELSRGFILDPKCWDPSPLCREPVRFKRTLRRNVATGIGKREYEVRRGDSADEGFIKPDEDEAAAHDQQKRHKFTDPATVDPRDLCQELMPLLGTEVVRYTHADLKRSTREFFLWRRQNSEIHSGQSAYLRVCLEYLIHGANGDDESKHARRVGYLLLDAFDGLNREFNSDERAKPSVQECSDWVALLAEVARDSERWEFLNLVLHAIDLTLKTAQLSQWGGSEKSSRLSFLAKLLAARSPRWNAVVVEVIRVFHVGEFIPNQRRLELTEDSRKVQSIFAEFVEQFDWQSAERLATVAQDHNMLQTLFKHLSLLNMTKALKRLHKVAVGIQSTPSELSVVQNAVSLAIGDIPRDFSGHPIDHVKNRSLNNGNKRLLKWKYIDSLEEMEKVIHHLEKRESTISSEDAIAQNVLVGIDCEWRPQLLQNSTSIDIGNDNLHDEDQVGLSIYQLAIGDVVYVIDVQVLGTAAAAPLSFIWRPASRLLLIGFCVSSDIQRIKNSFPSLGVFFDSTPLLLELKDIALFRHIPAKNWGLSRLYRECFGEQVDKEQQCSDWGSRPLSSSQLEYAARDAYAVQRLSVHLLADLSENCSMTDFLKCFDTGRSSWMMNSVSQPLGKLHVKIALQALGVDARFLKCDEIGEEGLIVKSIALIIRGEKLVNAPRRLTHAVAVLSLDRSIDMQALAALLEVDPEDISLADQEALVRVFGYSRGCLGPIGLREQQATRIIIDECLQSERYLLCGAGVADEVYEIAPNELIAAVRALVATIS